MWNRKGNGFANKGDQVCCWGEGEGDECIFIMAGFVISLKKEGLFRVKIFIIQLGREDPIWQGSWETLELQRKWEIAVCEAGNGVHSAPKVQERGGHQRDCGLKGLLSQKDQEKVSFVMWPNKIWGEVNITLNMNCATFPDPLDYPLPPDTIFAHLQLDSYDPRGYKIWPSTERPDDTTWRKEKSFCPWGWSWTNEKERQEDPEIWMHLWFPLPGLPLSPLSYLPDASVQWSSTAPPNVPAWESPGSGFSLQLAVNTGQHGDA